MKRKGHIYERMLNWDVVKRAQIESSKNKPNSYGVLKHKKHWMRDLTTLFDAAIAGEVKTGEYRRENIKSGQDKMRDVAKLDYFPDNIWHQMLVIVTEHDIDRTFINSMVFANRKGFGQVKALQQLQEWLKKYPKQTLWYAKGDICKYYPSIPHKLAWQEMNRTFKDKRYVEAFLEPMEKYTEDETDIPPEERKAIPIGTRPSQTLGNFCMRPFHRFMKEEVRVRLMIMYLDDFWILGRTKGEVKRNYKRAAAFLEKRGFRLHAPVFAETRLGVDGLGFVTYPGGDSFLRRKNKCRWLRHRSKVTNPKRIQELDAAAWGLLKHGNKHCHKLFAMATAKENVVTLADLGVKPIVATDKNGNKILDYPKIGMQTILDSEVDVVDFVENITTSMGAGRMAVAIEWNKKTYKVITNSSKIKQMIKSLDEKNVTRFTAIFYNHGGNNYDINVIAIREIKGFAVERSENGTIVFTHNKEKAL